MVWWKTPVQGLSSFVSNEFIFIYNSYFCCIIHICALFVGNGSAGNAVKRYPGLLAKYYTHSNIGLGL
jgi:hypothetical protein